MYDPEVAMHSNASALSTSASPPPGSTLEAVTGALRATSSSTAPVATQSTSTPSTLPLAKTLSSQNSEAGGGAPGSKMVTSEDLLLSVPTPVVRLLIILSRPIAFTRKAIEIVLWRSKSPVESWLVIGLWWALCLGGRAAWRWVLSRL